jgi:hypothetical protein
VAASRIYKSCIFWFFILPICNLGYLCSCVGFKKGSNWLVLKRQRDVRITSSAPALCHATYSQLRGLKSWSLFNVFTAAGKGREGKMISTTRSTPDSSFCSICPSHIYILDSQNIAETQRFVIKHILHLSTFKSQWLLEVTKEVLSRRSNCIHNRGSRRAAAGRQLLVAHSPTAQHSPVIWIEISRSNTIREP